MRNLIRSRNLLIGTGFALLIAVLAVAQFAFQNKAVAQGKMAPKFEVDPLLAQAPAQSLGYGHGDRRVGRQQRPYLDGPSAPTPSTAR